MPSRSPGALHVLTRPSMFLLHLVAVAGIVMAVWMGQWQIDAWQEHRKDRAAEVANDAPEPLADLMGPDERFPASGLGKPVTVAGEWLPDSTVYVAERPHEDDFGFWMVTSVATGPAAIPVVLGWSETLEQMPAVPTGDVEVTGWLQPGEAGKPDDDPEDDVLPTLRIADLLQRVDRDLYGGYVIMKAPEALRAGLTAVTPDSLPKPPTFTALRNLLYGLEWWCFAGFAAFLWWRWCRDEVVAARIPSEP